MTSVSLLVIKSVEIRKFQCLRFATYDIDGFGDHMLVVLVRGVGLGSLSSHPTFLTFFSCQFGLCQYTCTLVRV
jgi:hypothetical protein